LHEQALYPASGGVPSLPGVEEVVCAMNKAGVRMAVVTSSPTRLLEALRLQQPRGRARRHRAEKEKVFAMLEGVVCGDDPVWQAGPGDISEGRRGSRRAFLLL
jgi:phosphoserine phosphatase